jgi:hypothetical protein
MTKFDAKAQKCIFLGYSKRSKAYIVYNSKTKIVEESIQIRFDEKEYDNKISEVVESFVEI